MKAHPIAELFPLMPQAELEELADDIGANGQIAPIVVYAGQIIDGRNRWRACELAGVDPEVEEYNGLAGDIPAYIVSANIKRRHLDESQRAMIAAKIAKLPPSSNQHSEGTPIGVASKLLNVGTSSVDRAKAIINYGDDELVAAVERGEKSVSAAANEVKARKNSADHKRYRGSFRDSQTMLEALKTMNESLLAIRDMRPDSPRVGEVLEAARKLVATGKTIIATLEREVR